MNVAMYALMGVVLACWLALSAAIATVSHPVPCGRGSVEHLFTGCGR